MRGPLLVEDERFSLSLPMPLFVVVEDVGWWQGEDGSAHHQPYRNAFPRRHCLADYQALGRLAQALSMRLAIAMVLGEWDKSNLLRQVVGASWQGEAWDNRPNQGPWLAEAADYLRRNQALLEPAVHGLCHEFWQDGRMERAEFHDSAGRMRSPAIITSHLAAFRHIWEENDLGDFPRLFIPPALLHSFGDGASSIQALLGDFDIKYVITRFAKARQYAPPRHERLTWECGVGLLERGVSPAAWDVVGAAPAWLGDDPILALHWGNLLHADPAGNDEIIDGWAALLLNLARRPGGGGGAVLAACWRQAAVYFLAHSRWDGRGLAIDLRAIPDRPAFAGEFILKIREQQAGDWHCRGGSLRFTGTSDDGWRSLAILPDGGSERVDLYRR